MKKVLLVLTTVFIVTTSFAQTKSKDQVTPGTGATAKNINDTLEIKQDVKFIKVAGQVIPVSAFTGQKPVFLTPIGWKQAVTVLTNCKQTDLSASELFQLIQAISQQAQ
jgi:biopolymer transport protein ExbD